MTGPANTASSPRLRLTWMDAARGGALLAMASYHFMWDLASAGYAEPDFAATGWPRLYARAIATTFLLIAGMSLALAHHNGLDPKRFLRRLGLIVGAAAIVSLSTWFISPASFIYFGILHAMALFSLLALPFRRLPWWLVLGIGIGLVAAQFLPRQDFANHPWLWWTGLSPEVRHSDDFVPLIPWFGPFLIGLGLMTTALKFGLLNRFSGSSGSKPWPYRALSFLGRNSLVFYLVHQPVMIGALTAFALVVPPTPPDPVARYMRQCEASCTQTQGPGFCQRFCGCTVDRLMEKQLFTDMTTGRISANKDTRIQGIGAECTDKAFEGGPT